MGRDLCRPVVQKGDGVGSSPAWKPPSRDQKGATRRDVRDLRLLLEL
jgi:hypothetical protein